MSTRIAENGDTRVAESVAGLTGASSLNDATVTLVNKETFTLEPIARGWLVGSGWAWDAGNGNMEIV
jgi:hypothetical protein